MSSFLIAIWVQYFVIEVQTACTSKKYKFHWFVSRNLSIKPPLRLLFELRTSSHKGPHTTHFKLIPAPINDLLLAAVPPCIFLFLNLISIFVLQIDNKYRFKIMIKTVCLYYLYTSGFASRGL